ncbi:MAG TPA: sugar transferase, partial [Nitrospirota bacterium]|nr:sugar transferase [Nitrospirota bacterium]
GKNGKRFLMYKFRSMVKDAEAVRASLMSENEARGPIFKMKNDPRITRVGKAIRRTSMDELPQLFNVIRGEMSLVGPRPPIPSEVALYEEWQKERLAALPGITGLWQVSGRSALTFDEMVKWDIYYIRNWSLLLDFKILLKTIPAVFFTKGAY